MNIFVKDHDVILEDLGDGVSRKILGYNSGLMLVKVFFKAGAVGAAHQHPHQQVSYVLQGEFEVNVDGKTDVLYCGDSFVVSENARHGVVCRKTGILLDAFSPLRNDFLE